VNTVEELIAIQSQRKFCFELGNLESEIEKLKVAIQQKKRILIKKRQRFIVIDKLQFHYRKINRYFGNFRMPNVRFDIQVQVSQSYFSNGKDEVLLVFGK
jgi:DNA repair protein RecN (Recombination protein N)